MPIIKSAKKRVKVAAKAAARNQKTRRQLRDAIKNFTKALESGKSDKVSESLKVAIKAVDIAAKKNVIHKNKAARTKSNLSAKAKKSGSKPVKSSAKKASAPKKSVAKKK